MKKRYSAYILILMLITLCISGCSYPFGTNGSKKENEVAKPGYGEAYIYYYDDMRIIRRENVYQLRQPDVLTASVEELLSELMKEFEGIFSFYTYMFDENNVKLEVSFTATRPLTREEYLLSTAALCNTLFQLDGITGIKVNIHDEDDKVLLSEDYNRSSFFFGGYDRSEGFNEKSVKVYMPYGDAKLKAYMLQVNPDYHISEQELIINYLASQQCIPSKTSVISVTVSGGECVLDLSSDFGMVIPGKKETEVLYAVVNSITSLDKIESVRILIGGEDRDSFWGTVDISGPLVFNSEIVVE